MKQQCVLDRSCLPIERNMMLGNFVHYLSQRYHDDLALTKGEDFVDTVETTFVLLADYDDYSGAVDEKSIVIDMFHYHRGICIYREQYPVRWQRNAANTGTEIVTMFGALH